MNPLLKPSIIGALIAIALATSCAAAGGGTPTPTTATTLAPYSGIGGNIVGVWLRTPDNARLEVFTSSSVTCGYNATQDADNNNIWQRTGRGLYSVDGGIVTFGTSEAYDKYGYSVNGNNLTLVYGTPGVTRGVINYTKIALTFDCSGETEERGR